MLAGLLGLTALTEGSPARAQTPEPSVEESPQSSSTVVPKGEWYGWQTLLADGATIAITGLSAKLPQTEHAYGYFFAGGYFLGAPLVHLMNENFRGAGISLGLRLFLPLAGGLAGLGIGTATDTNSGGFDLFPLGMAVLGAGIGMLTAVVLDAALIARTSPPETRSALATRPHALRIVPTFGVTPRNASAGVAGVF